MMCMLGDRTSDLFISLRGYQYMEICRGQRIFFKKKNSNFAECRPEGTRQRIFLKKIQTLPSAGQGALGKEFLEKKTSLPRAG